MSKPKKPKTPKVTQQDAGKTILRAANGDVIQFDDTGLVMRLADRVVDDIARRLPTDDTVPDMARVAPDVLGDIDAWDVRVDGDWYVFHARLPGRQGVRQFRRLRSPDNEEIDPMPCADTHGPVLGFLSLGGARRARGFPQGPEFPYHIVAPADDIGAVGLAGETSAGPINSLLPVSELTRDSALADCLLSRCLSRFEPLSLCMARAEHDQSASIAQLSQGVAYQNLLLNFESLKQSAKRMNKSAVLAAIGLEFTLEDCMSSAEDWRAGLYDLLDQIRADVAKAGLRCPPILSLFDCGTQHINDHPILRAQWELTWTGHDHGFYFVAPSYMFHFDGQGRLAQQDLAAVAEMELAALQTLEQEKEWICPIVLLAEREPDPKVIRVRCRATDPLVLDATDPFGVGASCGFSFEGADHDVEITSVTIAPDDPCDVLITCRDAPMGDGLTLRYGFGQDIARNDVDHPSACGSLRDTWRHKTEAGRTLHKWAFPAALPVH